MANHYARLGVAPTATPEQIERAYLDSVFQTHPDLGGNAAGSGSSAARRAASAYAILSDPDRRAQHDTARARTRAAWRALTPLLWVFPIAFLLAGWTALALQVREVSVVSVAAAFGFAIDVVLRGAGLVFATIATFRPIRLVRRLIMTALFAAAVLGPILWDATASLDTPADFVPLAGVAAATAAAWLGGLLATRAARRRFAQRARVYWAQLLQWAELPGHRLVFIERGVQWPERCQALMRHHRSNRWTEDYLWGIATFGMWHLVDDRGVLTAERCPETVRYAAEGPEQA